MFDVLWIHSAYIFNIISVIKCRNNYNVLLVFIFSAIKKKISLNGGGGMSQLLHCPIPANGVT